MANVLNYDQVNTQYNNGVKYNPAVVEVVVQEIHLIAKYHKLMQQRFLRP